MSPRYGFEVAGLDDGEAVYDGCGQVGGCAFQLVHWTSHHPLMKGQELGLHQARIQKQAGYLKLASEKEI